MHVDFLFDLLHDPREITILKKLQHKNVIELVEVFEDPEKQKLYPLCSTLLLST